MFFEKLKNSLLKTKEAFSESVNNVFSVFTKVDEDFLNALAYGMPNCSGNALGVDRLVMLISGASNIHDCVWIPKL